MGVPKELLAWNWHPLYYVVSRTLTFAWGGAWLFLYCRWRLPPFCRDVDVFMEESGCLADPLV